MASVALAPPLPGALARSNPDGAPLETKKERRVIPYVPSRVSNGAKGGLDPARVSPPPLQDGVSGDVGVPVSPPLQHSPCPIGLFLRRSVSQYTVGCHPAIELHIYFTIYGIGKRLAGVTI